MTWIADWLTYTANGGLYLLYGVVDTTPQWLSILSALFIAMTFDRWAQLQAVYAPGRYDNAPLPTAAPKTAQTITGVTLGVWLCATWAFGPPVPLIGAVMWFVAALALAVMPQQRWSLLWTTKAGLMLYSIAIFGYRLYLWQASQLSASELADVFGGRATAAQLIAQNTGTFATIGAWLLWAVLPAGYLGLLLQNWAAQPMSLVTPLAGMKDVLTVIRARSHSQNTRPERQL